jgi:arabinan endo-1,5-alpha-L-arabinosidase
MAVMRKLLLAASALLGAVATVPAVAQSPTLNSQLTGDLVPTHDPVITREGDTYYVFGTGVPGEAGRYLLSRTSKDLVHWTAGKPLFDHIPDWAQKAVPGTKEMWAPDISFVNGRWRLYYAVSTFGGNRSAIGLFTSPTLDPAKPGYGWRDEGLVLMSQNSDDYNAIDPNATVDAQGRHWLSFGSFWTGIKLVELDAKPASRFTPRPSRSPSRAARRPRVRPRPSRRPLSCAMAGPIGCSPPMITAARA